MILALLAMICLAVLAHLSWRSRRSASGNGGAGMFQPGMVKSTYGTECFVLLNTGGKPVLSNNRLLATIACQLDGKPTYALEGSIFIAGAVVQWLRDSLKMIRTAAETTPLDAAADETEKVYFVPAYTGLGAPYWDAECRGAIFGLTRNTGTEEIAKAALESVGYQTRDLIEAMNDDWGANDKTILRIDGGMANSVFAMQALANQLHAPVDRPEVTETKALGGHILRAWPLVYAVNPKNFRKVGRWKISFSQILARRKPMRIMLVGSLLLIVSCFVH